MEDKMPKIKRSKEQIELDIKEQHKICCVCNVRKPFDLFFNFKNKSDGKSYRCKECDNFAKKTWSKNNPEKAYSAMRQNNLKTKYKVDLNWYENQFKEQDFKCAICETTENTVVGSKNALNFAVDHDHETGKVRGLLCNQCNRALGMFKDSQDILKKAVSYLKKHK